MSDPKLLPHSATCSNYLCATDADAVAGFQEEEPGVGLRLRVNPDGPGGSHCLYFDAYFSGANNDLQEFKAHLFDACAGGDPVPVKTVGTTLTVPRKLSKAFGKGAKLTAPQALSFLSSGSYPMGVVGPFVDTTKIGKDYKFVDK
jgi:hypothetical protein